MFLVSTTNLVQEHWKAGCRSPLVKPLALAAQDVAATRLFLWCAERQLGNWLGRNQLGSVARSKTNRSFIVRCDVEMLATSFPRPNLQSAWAALFLAHFLFCHHPISSPSHLLPIHPACLGAFPSLEEDQIQCFHLCCPTRKCTAYNKSYSLVATGMGEINYENVFIDFNSTTPKGSIHSICT